MIYKAGSGKTDSYVNRCVEDLRCICYERGDRNVYVDGGSTPYCIIIDKEFFKYEDLGDVGVNSSTIEAIWLAADCIPITSRSRIWSCGYEYKVKGSPMDLCDGWMAANLSKPCRCQ